MASNQFRAAKKKIRRATTEAEIKEAMDTLDEQWAQDPLIMRGVHWVAVSALVGKVVRRHRLRSYLL